MHCSRKAFKTAVTLIGAAAITAATSGTASAEGIGVVLDKPNVLHTRAFSYVTATGATDPSTCSTSGWQLVKSDSPIDNNSRALATNICAPTDTTSDYALAWSHASLNIDSLVGDVQNLSFDFRSDLARGGSPRITVLFNNGDAAYLSATGCANPFAVAPSWSRADFTGATSDCSFTVNGATGGTYAADGTNSAWDVYAAAHPEQFVSRAYLIFDDPGTYRVDRLALGTDYLYNYSNTRGYPCQDSEARC